MVEIRPDVPEHVRPDGIFDGGEIRRFDEYGLGVFLALQIIHHPVGIHFVRYPLDIQRIACAGLNFLDQASRRRS
ncbi:hypothetical protein D3C81_1796070 [compost metagenome]